MTSRFYSRRLTVPRFIVSGIDWLRLRRTTLAQKDR
jgi:hypothetical protein